MPTSFAAPSAHHRRRLPKLMSHHRPCRRFQVVAQAFRCPLVTTTKTMGRCTDSTRILQFAVCQPPITNGKCMIGRDRAFECELSHARWEACYPPPSNPDRLSTPFG